ncbi:class I SAM-dependent methyltransferase [Lamprobacter modestohalophilus]|uniref:class I SAM-dependent methyltransferase n=1 Tax=Lamprobacter modestohalophilus TaxID=1064514 RepID=UPI002ADECAA1|nr:class I SAM-dependent methyltransferase [Lamprobacter modestohalophilus]MEA1048976.1 class I SAM-dependent methyltransferase [Lamprobacter modestohalophilus]
MLEASLLAPAQARRSAPPRGLPFWVFAAVLLLSPLPFASVYPVWPAVYGVLIAMAILALVLQRWRLRRGLTMPQPTVLAASLLALGVIGWGFAQSLPGLLPAWQHPVWEQTRELLQLPELAGALALVPERSAQVATHYLTYLAFAWLAFWQCRRSRNRAHPVWLLNGLFIEQHAQSLDNRRRFTDWVAAQSPRRVADYGGGFGGLARMIGAACPSAEVEVIEPHPHPLAIERARRSPNVHYRPALDGEYDILIATDVFEHVPDPLGLAAETAAALKPGGHYLSRAWSWSSSANAPHNRRQASAFPSTTAATCTMISACARSTALPMPW